MERMLMTLIITALVAMQYAQVLPPILKGKKNLRQTIAGLFYLGMTTLLTIQLYRAGE